MSLLCDSRFFHLAAAAVCATAVCVGCATIAPPAPRAATKPIPEAFTYAPPPDASQASRLGGGVRGATAGPGVYLLLPRGVARTVRPGPTIYWYLTQDTPADIDLVVTRIGAFRPLLKRTLRGPNKAGLHALDLAADTVVLEPQVLHKVTVFLWCDPTNSGLNPFSAGFVKRVSPPVGLVDDGSSRDYLVYAKAGLWCDALCALQQRIQSEPANAALDRALLDLLRREQVCLTFTPPAGTADLPAVQRAADDALAREESLLQAIASVRTLDHPRGQP